MRVPVMRAVLPHDAAHLFALPKTPAREVAGASARRQVLILGTRGDATALFERLPDTPYVFAVAGDASNPTPGLRPPPDIVIAVMRTEVPFSQREGTRAPVAPWIAWNRGGQPALAVAAYEAGARAVLPEDVSPAAFWRYCNRRSSVVMRRDPGSARAKIHTASIRVGRGSCCAMTKSFASFSAPSHSESFTPMVRMS